MANTRAAWSLVFLAALLPGQTQSPAGAQVDGVVVDTISGAPVRRAVVQLRFSGGGQTVPQSMENADYAAVTGPDGAFHFEQLPPGAYLVSYSRAGYLAPRPSSGYSSRSVRVLAGAAVKGLRYGLIPQAVVSGRVVDDEGDPVENVQVALLAFRYSGGIRRLVRLSEGGTSNDRGEYRVARVPAGKYFVQASLDRLPPGSALLAGSHAPGAPLVTYASTFYPGATDPGQALRVELHAGQELPGVDIQLQRTTMVRVSGRVIGPDGVPMARAFLTLISAQSHLPTGFGAPADEAGNFSLKNVRAGSYILNATANGNRNISVPLEVGSSDILGFTAQASPTVSVRGSVSVEEAARSFNLAAVTVQLRFADSGMPAGNARPAADGSFTFENLAPGRYVASVSCGAAGAYVQSLSGSGEDLLGREFDLSAASGGLRIVLRTDSATLSGTVETSISATPADRQGRPAVVLIPADARLRGVDLPTVTPISSKNSFSAAGLRPGDYLAIAFEDVDEAELQDPEFLSSLEALATRVQLSPGETQTITLKWNAWPETAAGY
ncbi:MAG: carboxypeptidase regulatory-like domain-containing protein [Bryobacteraceae bacterium]|nr:carboxypeptidase regulatory-like domain-containing protein [Bryobacteraceae bacterium]